jgi:hypothetical protein
MKQYDEAVTITTQLIHNKFSSTKLLQLRARAFYYLVRASLGACLMGSVKCVDAHDSTCCLVRRCACVW